MSDSLRNLVTQIAERIDLEAIPDGTNLLSLEDSESGRRATLCLESMARFVSTLSAEQLRSRIEQRIAMVARALCRAEDSSEARLYPLIRPPEPKGQPHWAEPIAEGRLRFLLVRDATDHLRVLTPLGLVETGHSIPTLRRMAIENLSSRSCTADLTSGPQSGSLCLRKSDGLAAARALVVHHLIPDPRGLLLLLPCRDRLWIVPASAPSAFERVLSLREEAIRVGTHEPYPISAEIFWQKQGSLRHLPVKRCNRGWCFTQLPSELEHPKESVF